MKTQFFDKPICCSGTNLLLNIIIEWENYIQLLNTLNIKFKKWIRRNRHKNIKPNYKTIEVKPASGTLLMHRNHTPIFFAYFFFANA